MGRPHSTTILGKAKLRFLLGHVMIGNLWGRKKLRNVFVRRLLFFIGERFRMLRIRLGAGPNIRRAFPILWHPRMLRTVLGRSLLRTTLRLEQGMNNIQGATTTGTSSSRRRIRRNCYNFWPPASSSRYLTFFLRPGRVRSTPRPGGVALYSSLSESS